jgi:hypothetical protein
MTQRPDIPADVRRLLERERENALLRANEIAAVLGMRFVTVNRADPKPEPRWRSDDGVREGSE